MDMAIAWVGVYTKHINEKKKGRKIWDEYPSSALLCFART